MNAVFSSERHDWETPLDLFLRLEKCILAPSGYASTGFHLDAAASKHNALCDKFYTAKDNGLRKPWASWTWCNPPYGAHTDRWVCKAIEESKRGVCSALLIASRTETKRFHWAVEAGAHVLFLKGRVQFCLDGKQIKTGAPFPSCVLFFGPVLRSRCAKLGAFMEGHNDC